MIYMLLISFDEIKVAEILDFDKFIEPDFFTKILDVRKFWWASYIFISIKNENYCTL